MTSTETLLDTKDFIEKNQDETFQLSEQHDVFKASMGGKLVIAPVDFSKPGLRILDCGTADAYWITDLQRDIPSPNSHTYIGTDVTRNRFPSSVPTNTTLIIQSITEPYPESWKHSFDFVHQRFVLAGCRGFPLKDAVRNLAMTVKPGGWIQFIEPEQLVDEDNGPVMHEFIAMVQEVLKLTGIGIDYTPMISSWLEEAGMEEIHERKCDMLLGALNPDPELAEKGARSSAVAMSMFVKLLRSLPIQTSFSNEQLETVVHRFKQELRAQGGNYPFRVIWAHQPQAIG